MFELFCYYINDTVVSDLKFMYLFEVKIKKKNNSYVIKVASSV